MAAETIKHVALQGVEGAWHYAALAASVGQYVGQDPKAAVSSGAKKLLKIGLITPARQIGLSLSGLAMLIWEPVPWAGRGIVLGLRFGHNKIVNSITDQQKIPLYTPDNSRSMKVFVLQKDALEELKKGLACAFVMAARLDSIPRTIKINKLMYASHVGVMVPVKIAKIMLISALVHSTPLAHLAIGHFLAGGYEEHLLSSIPSGPTGEQIAIGTGIVYATHSAFVTTLKESNLWEKDMEIVGQSREFSLVRRALGDLTKALAALEPFTNSSNQTEQPTYISRKEMRHLERGLATARRLGIHIQDPKFSGFQDEGFVEEVKNKVNQATRRFGKEKDVDLKWTPIGQGLGPNTLSDVLPTSDGEKSIWMAMGRAFKETKLFTKSSEKISKYQLNNLTKAALDADKVYQRRVARWSRLNDSGVDKANDRNLQLKIEIAYCHAQVALHRAQDAHRLVASKQGIDSSDSLKLHLTTAETEKKSLAALAASRHPAMNSSSRFGRLLLRGYTARRSMYDKKAADLLVHARQVGKLVEGAALYAKPQLAARATKIAEKALIAQLKAKQAGLDQAITSMALRKVSDLDAQIFRLNREEFLQYGQAIAQAKLRYQLAADAQKRTSAYVVPGAQPFKDMPALINASIKLGWYGVAVFPGINLPYWGLRYFLCAVSHERFQTAVNQAVA